MLRQRRGIAAREYEDSCYEASVIVCIDIARQQKVIYQRPSMYVVGTNLIVAES